MYQQCTISVLDTNDDPNIVFDEKGICHYFYEFERLKNLFVKTGKEGENELDKQVSKIVKDGKNKPYDSIIGLSGGVDSSYMAYQAKKLGLRPLAVHFDNGWNSELAVKNIENIVNRLGFDLHTHVADWETFKDVQLAYFKASVVDIEVVTDHAIFGVLYRLAKKYNIKYLLSGSNVLTEATLPPHWIFNKNDHVNLKSIHKQFGKKKLDKYPLLDTALKKYCQYVLKTEYLCLLNNMEYNKAKVKQEIIEALNWKDYGGKHYESVFTRFYQAYMLPTKFGIDKRKAHLSDLIFAGQITKNEALEALQKPLYEPAQLEIDKVFVIKKWELSASEFEAIMQQPPRPHLDFATETSIYNRYPALKVLRPIIRRLMT